MTHHSSYFESVIGKDYVFTGDQKLPFGVDYTKVYSSNPLLAVLPQSTEEVSKILKYCSKNNLSVVPSGGRTGLSGGAVAKNGEVVISLSRMNKIFEINKIDKTIHCQGGVITKVVQQKVQEAGLYFPVDFASSGSSHIAGNIATNAGGIKVIRYGLTRQWVQGLEVVLADGSILDMENACIKNNTGYDLKHLFIGSEGTLGIITKVLLKLTMPPSELKVSLFGLNTLEHVTDLFDLVQIEKVNLTAYEFFTQFSLEKVQEHTKLQSPFSTGYPYYVLIESENANPDDEKKLESFIEKAFEKKFIVDGVMAQSSQQSVDFWGLRENVSESISALTVIHKNDISIPLSKLAQFCKELEVTISTQYPGFGVANFGHIGDGNLHVNFVKPDKMPKDEFFDHAKKADKTMFELVSKFGGSVSAEHGIGLTKKDFLNYTRSDREIDLMRQIKKVFDPTGIMNPGKIF